MAIPLNLLELWKDTMHIRQAVILCGGLGSRLGELTAATPKPLLDVGGQPFLEILIQELTRFGIEDILLLAAYRSERIESFAECIAKRLRRPLKISISIEPNRAGTGGALYYAKDHLAEQFFLLNGDSLFDVNLLSLAALLREAPEAKAAIALRPLPEAGRYDTVALDGRRINRFGGWGVNNEAVLINGGVYAMRRSIIDDVTETCSLERDVLPSLATSDRLRGMMVDRFFIDIGVPKDFARAQAAIPAHRRRPAIFLDRDGVINQDYGHVGTMSRFAWIEGASQAIRMLNDCGFYVFVVTNQAGIGKGYYSEDDYLSLRRYIHDCLMETGAHIDDERYCPYHPAATIEAYRRESDWRKPAPGMILDLIQAWPINTEESFLIGDKASDIEAAEAAGIKGILFEGGKLDTFVEGLLKERLASSPQSLGSTR